MPREGFYGIRVLENGDVSRRLRGGAHFVVMADMIAQCSGERAPESPIFDAFFYAPSIAS
jgi:hypothetical protein